MGDENAGDHVEGDKITEQPTGSDGAPESPSDGEQPADVPAESGDEEQGGEEE